MKKTHLAGHLSIFGANFVWGAMSPIIKYVFSTGYVSPLVLVSFRMIGAALLFWLLSLLTGGEKVTPRDKMLFFLAGMFGVVLNQGLFTFGLQQTSPVDASVIATSIPIFTMLIAAFHLREPMTLKKVSGVLLGAIGAVFLILSGVEGGLGGSVVGDILCFAAELFFSCYLVFFKGLISRYSPFTVMKWMFTWSAASVVPFTFGDIMAVNFSALPVGVIAGVGMSVFFATFLCYLLTSIGQKSLRPTVVSMYFYLQPVTAAILATIMGSAGSFGLVKILSIVMIFTGVGLVMASKSRADIEGEQKTTALAQKNT